MKLTSLLFAAGAGAAAIHASDLQILQSLLEYPEISYSPTHTRLVKELSKLHKRQLDLSGLLGSFGSFSLSDLGKKDGKGGYVLDLGGLLSFGGKKITAGVAPQSKVAEVQEATPKYWPESKAVKIRYGPFRMPPASEENAQSKWLALKGMSDFLQVGLQKPCNGECSIQTLWADLEYADGSHAGNENGTWLHHAVLLNNGPNAADANCGRVPYENIFMSGNERSIMGFGLAHSKVKSGYSLSPKDKFILQLELMNMDDVEKFVWLTINYEFVEGALPDYKQGKTIWTDISPYNPAKCAGSKQFDWGPSNLTKTQQPKTNVFSEHSQPWQAQKNGLVMTTGGHMHDGGVSLQIYLNNKVICDSAAIYSEKGGGMGMPSAATPAKSGNGAMIIKRHEPGTAMGTVPSAKKDKPLHIDHQEGCLYMEGLPFSKGDTMHLQANYDFTKFEGAKNAKGDLDEVMGIVGTLVVFDK